MLHTSANFEKSKTQVFSKKYFFSNLVLNMKQEKRKNKVHLFTFYSKCKTETLRIIQTNSNNFGFTAWHDYFIQF